MVDKNKYTKELISATLIMFLLVFAGYIMNSIFIVLVYFSAIPIAYVLVLKGIKYYLPFSILEFLIIYTITNNIKAAILVSLMCMSAGFMLGFCWEKDLNTLEIFTLTTLGYIIPLIIMILILNYVEGVNQIEAYVLGPVDQWMKIFTEDIEKIYASGQQLPFDISDIGKQVELLKYSISILLPGIFITFFGVISVIDVYITANILKKKELNYGKLMLFPQLKANRTIVWIYILSWLGMATISNKVISGAMANMNFIIYATLIVFGLAVIEFFLKKRVRKVFMRILIYIIITILISPVVIFLPFLSPMRMMVFIGILDSFFDFRKLPFKGEKNG